jgi:uncharacterized protein (TIGR03435 family)
MFSGEKLMKKLLLWLVALASFSAGALHAQDIVGTWQGTMQAEKDLRIVVKISKAESGDLKAMVYNIDQGGQGMPTTASLQESIFKIAVPGVGEAYEGKLASDGKTITGTFKLAPKPLPLVLTHVTPETAWAIPAPPPPQKMMAADASPTFDVATIKPSDPEKQGKGIRVNERHFTTLNTTLADLIEFSYGVHLRQIVGAPEWIDKDKFDISAVPDGEGQPNDKQWKGMLQKLLADRFKLKFHHDKKELSAYALTLGKPPLKITKSTSDGPLPGLFFRPTPGGISLGTRNANMDDFTNLLQSSVLDRPVVDQTGIVGRYDFILNFAPDDSQFNGRFRNPPPSDNPLPGLFTAIQEQLGLKLDPVKTPVGVLMIDQVAKPTDN